MLVGRSNPCVSGLGRLDKPHPGERRVIFRKLNAGLELKHADSAPARFAPCGFYQLSTDAGALQGRADGKLADVKRVVLGTHKDTADQIACAIGQQQHAAFGIGLHRLRRQP